MSSALGHAAHGALWAIYDTADQNNTVRFPGDGQGSVVTTYAGSHLAADGGGATGTTIYAILAIDTFAVVSPDESWDWQILAEDGTTVLLSGSVNTDASGDKHHRIPFGDQGINIRGGFGILANDAANTTFSIMVIYDVAGSNTQAVVT